MADSTKNLGILMSAKDEATAVIKNVGKVTKETAEQIEKANKDIADSTNKSGDSQKNLSTSVFKGVFAYDTFKKTLEVTRDFMKESIQAYTEAQDKMDLVRANVESAGLAFESVSPQIDEFAQKMAKMGVDDEDASLSVAKLAKSLGGDLTKAFQLSKLASDLASSGFGDLNANTDMLQSVLVGRTTPAIKQFKLQLDETATTEDVLNAIQEKVTRTTEERAKTVVGSADTMAVAYANLKEEVGKGFVSALQSAIGSGEQMSDITDLMADAGTSLKYVVFETVTAFDAMIEATLVLGKSLLIPVKGYQALGQALGGDLAGAADTVTDALDDIEESTVAFNKAMTNLYSPTVAMTQAEKVQNEERKKTKKIVDDVGAGVSNSNKVAKETTDKHSEAVANLGDEYKKLRDTAKVSLSDLSDTFKNDMDAINKSISGTKQAMADLQRQYSAGVVSDTASVAEKIVATEQNVATLRKQLLAETDANKRKDLNEQLIAEMANLDSAQVFREQNQTAIDEAERRSKLTSLQREIEDYNSRRSLALEEFNSKMSDLSNQLNEEKKKKKELTELYKQRTAEITKIIQSGTDEYKKQAQERLAISTEEVNAEIELYKKLASAIANVKGASKSNISTVGSKSISGARASGGPVSGGNAYIVGEKGQEVFVPNNSGTIIPNDALGGGGGIVININGGTFLDPNVAKEIGDMIIGQYKLLNRI